MLQRAAESSVPSLSLTSASQAAPAAVPRYLAQCRGASDSDGFTVAAATLCFNCCEEKCLRVEGDGKAVRDLMLKCKVQCSEHCGW